MIILLAVLSLSGVVLAQRNPNPCAGAPPDSFVNDYTSCASYFYCDSAEVAFPTGPCGPGFSFDVERQACSTDAAICLPCPAEGTIAVGVEEDTTCTQFQLCVESVRDTVNIVTCPPDTLFNRVTGVCADAATVICPGPPGVTPPAGVCVVDGVLITGDRNSDTACNEFIHCVAGVLSEEIFTCGQLHFNPVSNVCDLPENLVPPCVDARTAGQPTIRKAPHIQALSFRQRFMRKLHL